MPQQTAYVPKHDKKLLQETSTADLLAIKKYMKENEMYDFQFIEQVTLIDKTVEARMKAIFLL